MRKCWWLLIVVLIWGCQVTAAPSGYDLVAENEYLELYFNSDTAEVAVFDKQSEKFWYSNPPNRAQEEQVARGKALGALGAQIFVTYFTQIGAEVTLDNYNDSIVYNQMEFRPIDNGVRIEFTLGQEWTEDAYIPNIMTKQRFEEAILAQVTDEADREFLLDQYTLVWFEDAPEGYSRVSVTQVDKERLLGGKTLSAAPEDLERRNAKRDLYNTLFDHIVGRSDVARRSDITPNIMQIFMQTPLYMLGNRVSRWDKSDIAAIMQDIGFTPYERSADLEYFGFPEQLPNHRVFRVAIEYYLDGPNFLVRVPLEDVSYPINALDPADQEAPPVTLPVYSLTILPYFGAANSEQEGYMFVPDGPGVLVHLNNGKTQSPSLMVNVYGRDNGIGRTERVRNLVDAGLPVFGMKQDDYGFLAIIEEGETVARIRAEVAGRSHSYNVVNSEFIVTPKGSAYLQTTDVFTREVVIAVPQSRAIEGDLQIRYSFLDGDDATYVGMAHHYQDYLQEKGMKPLERLEDIPFYLELVGAVQVKRPILGVPQTIIRPLTTYEQTQIVVDELLDAGIRNVHVRYDGWLNGGIDHDFPTKVKWESEVGGRDGFLELVENLHDRKVKLFPDVSFLTVAKNSMFDGFLAPRDAGRFLDRAIAKKYSYDRATYQAIEGQFRYVLSPKRLDAVLDGFMDDYGTLGVTGLSLNDLGSELNSDFRYDPKELIDRQQAKRVIITQFNKMANYELMVNGGFAYSLPYVNHVLNVPLYSNRYQLADETVPFYQIVARGFVNYAGEPINFAQDVTYNVLKTIETGACPYYLWSYMPSTEVKHTDYDDLFSIYYKDWFGDAVDFYLELNEELGMVQGQRIIGHAQVRPGVYQTIYENGTFTLVNYGDAAAEYAGVTVPAQGYTVVEGGN